MRSRKPLVVVLAILIAGLGYLMNRMGAKQDPYAIAPPPPDKIAQKRASDLDKLLDVAAKNWELDPKLKTVKSKTGIKYQDIRVGGGRMPKRGERVVVDYVGWTTKGRMFDTSMKEDRQPFAFRIGKGQVIKGWDEGVSTMREGGTRRIVIPPELGYGEIGNVPTIEPNATLVFMVRLITIPKK